MILNFFGAIVGFVWLAILGKWSIIGLALALGIGGPVVISLLLLPGMAASYPGLMLWKKIGIFSKIAALPLMAGGFLWTWAVMGGWAFFSFYLITKGVFRSGITAPYLLAAYFAATGPWMYLAQKDTQSGNNYSLSAVFFLQIATIVFGVGLWLRADGWHGIAAGLILLAGILFQLLEVWDESRRRPFYDY